MASFTVKPNEEDLQFPKQLIETGAGRAPVINKTYPLSEVSEAIQYLDKGHAKGKVVVSV
jgi:NADPH:quinone reductase-like Zn-dependent oxidoreductase